MCLFVALERFLAHELRASADAERQRLEASRRLLKAKVEKVIAVYDAEDIDFDLDFTEADYAAIEAELGGLASSPRTLTIRTS
jgi:hypothetical protein